MAIYYLDKLGNYLSDYNNNFYIHEAGNRDPVIKKYRPVIYKNGKFIKLKPFIGQWKSNGLLTNEELYFTTADGSYFITKDINDGTELTFVFTQMSPYFIKGVYEATLLTDNNGNILTNNYGDYLSI